MSTTIDDRTIVNNALAMIGSEPVGALDEESELAEKVRAVYQPRIDALLGLFEWSFNAKTYQLDQLAEEAANDFDAASRRFKNGWRYGFSMPGTRLSVPRKVLVNPRAPHDPLRDFMVEQDAIYADLRPLWAVFPVRAHPSVWLPAFRLAAQTLVAADLCVPVSHDAGMADALRERGEGPVQEQGRGGMVGQAIAVDHAGARRKAPQWSDPLTDARMS